MATQRTSVVGELSPARKSLILAAERLVARYGVSGFTTRMLNAEAGARNASALHYHFGSREDLVRAVWEYRMATINPRRLELLRGVTPPDVERIVEALILPLAEQLEPRPEGNSYLRFVERVVREAAYGPDADTELPWTEGWHRAYGLLRQSLAGEASGEVIERKIRFARILVISGLAGVEADLERGELSLPSLPGIVDVLKDSVVALIGTPRAGMGETAHP